MIFRLYGFQSRKHLGRSALYAVLMALFSIGAVLLYDADTIEGLSQLRAGAPFPAAMLGLGGSAALLNHLVSLAYGFLLPLSGSLLAVALASRLMAGQAQTGEMAYYLALPLRRRTLALTQALVVLTLLAGAVLFQALSGWLAAFFLKQEQLSLPRYLLMNLGLYAQTAFTAAVSMMLSCVSDERRQASLASKSLFGILLLLSLLSRPHGMPGFLSWIGVYSLIDSEMLSKGAMGPRMLVVPVLALVFLSAGLFRFSRRDLAL